MGNKRRFAERRSTTVRMPPDLLVEFRVRCYRDKLPLNQVMVGLIERYLERAWKYGICSVHGREAVNGRYPCC